MQSYHGFWQVNEEGFIFVNQIVNDEYLKRQIKVINNILYSLIDENKAKYIENGILIAHEIAACLPNEEKSSLLLPESFPFTTKITSSGKLTDTNLKFNISFLRDKHSPFIKPKRIGALLQITEEQSYLLADDLYHLVYFVEKFNESERFNNKLEQQKINLISFAKIRELSKNLGAQLDPELDCQNVIIPEKISVQISSLNDGSLELSPVLMIRKSKEAFENLDCYDDTEVSRYKKVPADVNNIFCDYYNKRLNRVLDAYPISDGSKIVFDKPQKEALEIIKKHKKILPKEKAAFLESPQTVLASEAFIFDDFADRVLEIGEYKPKVFPFIRPLKESWLPPEGGLVLDGVECPLSKDDIKKIYNELSLAEESGDKNIIWNDKKIPVDENTKNALDDLISIGMSDAKSSSGTVVEKIRRENKKNVLIIRDNFSELEFTQNQNIRQGSLKKPNSILHGIQSLPHQDEGLMWMQQMWLSGMKGALLADDMGLGKTFQALAFISWVKELMDKGVLERKPMLVVAPVVLLKNWNQEYNKFFDTSIFGQLTELHGDNLKFYKNNKNAKEFSIKRETDLRDVSSINNVIKKGNGLLLEINKLVKSSLILTTYETLRDYQVSLGLIDWSVIVLDEAQKIKTPTAMMTSAVKAMKYDFGLCLTGTPVENSWIDLWSLFDFIQPGKLGSLVSFNKRFQLPLKKPETDREKLGLDLQDEIKPQIMRRLKEERLKGLPIKKIESYEVEMPQVQLEAYLSVVNKAKNSLKDKFDTGNKQHIFATISSLREISLHPYLSLYSEQGLWDISDEKIISSSARVSITFEILDKIRQKQEKALIFIMSKKMQRLLVRLLENRYGIECQRAINGDVPGDKRDTMIKAFQKKTGFQVLVLSPEAAGVGLNITAANHVIHLGRCWNPAKEDQATDRVFRIGQEKDVTVHLPMAVAATLGENGAFDQKLHKLLMQKRHLSSSVLLPPVISEDDMFNFGMDLISKQNVVSEDITYMSPDDIDKLTPESFEKLISIIYEKLGFQVELTKRSNDYGADVVVHPNSKNQPGILVQCKHTTNPPKSIGPDGVQEIISAKGVYGQSYNYVFDGVVVTNALGYTDNACKVAASNNITLLSRKDIADWLSQRKVLHSEVLC